jgi:(p)ppGpp synthase/HD superfamily hydrolase
VSWCEHGSVLGERFVAAFEEAFRVHQLDRRKGADIPYVSHLMAVAALVLESGGDEDEAIAALLHDAAEDHGGEARLAVIGERFGERVAELVRGLSDTLSEDKEPWLGRKERYLAKLGDEQDLAILRISRADKLHNARAILRDLRVERELVWQRFKVGAESQLWYYDSLAAIFSEKLPGVLSDELAETVDTLRLESGIEAGSEARPSTSGPGAVGRPT